MTYSTNPRQECISCHATYDIGQHLIGCKGCGSLLDVTYEMNVNPRIIREVLKSRREHPQGIFDESGVWRFRNLFPFYEGCNRPIDEILVSLDGREGATKPLHATGVAKYVGMNPKGFYLQFEGLQPTGSFKDNGTSVGHTHAKMIGAKKVACASTGNTSASMAAFAANEGDVEAYVFLGKGRVAKGKLAQTLDYGAKVIEIESGNFDDAMTVVQNISSDPSNGIYLMNSINPFRLEGQKTIVYRALEGLNWHVPDWIVCPGGGLGNTSAFGKALRELYEWGLIDKVPRLAVVQAEGASPLENLYSSGLRWNGGNWNKEKVDTFYRQGQEVHTVATAIEIGKPVNLPKALRELEYTNGVVTKVSDREIMDAKAVIGRNLFGCEPASATTVAGIKKLIRDGIMNSEEVIVGILTGHQLKDPSATIEYHSDARNRFANTPIVVPNDAEKILQAMGIRT